MLCRHRLQRTHVLVTTVACMCFWNRFHLLLMSSDALRPMDALLSCCGSRESATSSNSESLETTRLAGIGVVFKHAGADHFIFNFRCWC